MLKTYLQRKLLIAFFVILVYVLPSNTFVPLDEHFIYLNILELLFYIFNKPHISNDVASLDSLSFISDVTYRFHYYCNPI